MARYMSETEKRSLKPRGKSEFFTLKVLRRFSKREIANAEELAMKEECTWLELEAWLFEKGRVGK